MFYPVFAKNRAPFEGIVEPPKDDSGNEISISFHSFQLPTCQIFDLITLEKF